MRGGELHLASGVSSFAISISIGDSSLAMPGSVRDNEWIGKGPAHLEMDVYKRVVGRLGQLWWRKVMGIVVTGIREQGEVSGVHRRFREALLYFHLQEVYVTTYTNEHFVVKCTEIRKPSFISTYKRFMYQYNLDLCILIET